MKLLAARYANRSVIATDPAVVKEIMEIIEENGYPKENRSPGYNY